MSSYPYRNSYYKDETVSYNAISILVKRLYIELPQRFFYLLRWCICKTSQELYTRFVFCCVSSGLVSFDSISISFRVNTVAHNEYYDCHIASEAILKNDAKYIMWILQAMIILTHLPPWQHGHHLTDDIYRSIFVNEKFCILNKMSLKFVSNWQQPSIV